MTNFYIIEQVWNKARAISLADELLGIRTDECNARIRKSDYGNRDSPMGWEIDHIVPTSKGGSDALYNLRPLHWQNNAAKSDGRLVCVVGYR